MASAKLNRQNKKIKRRKSGRYTLHYILLLTLMSCIALILSFTIFFSVEWIDVSEIEQYSKEDIILKSEIKKGDNLLRLDKAYHEKKIQEQFSYIEKASIKKMYPVGLKINLTIAEPYATLKIEDNYVLISKTGKIIETDIKIKPEGVLEIRGVPITRSQEGIYFLENAKEALKVLNTFIEISEKTGLTNYNWIDLRDDFNIKILYENRLLIEYGSLTELERKMNFVKEVITTGLKPTDTGIIYASDISDSAINFIEKDINLLNLDKIDGGILIQDVQEEPVPQPDDGLEDSKVTSSP